MKKIIVICVLGILIIGYIIATPFLTVNNMKNAAEKHDGEELSEYVDFISLRQDLKDQMNILMGKEMLKLAEDNNPFASMGVAFGTMFVDKMVDAYITPTAITELMKGAKPNSEDSQNTLENKDSLEPFKDASIGYESFSKFSILVTNNETGDDVRFILRRRGLSWKLTEIKIPLDNPL